MTQEKIITDNTIKKYLINIGISPRYAGLQYIMEAIKMTIQYQKMPRKIYQRISEKYNVSYYSIERAIRYAIEKMYLNLKNDLIENYIDHNKGKPTNYEFINYHSFRIGEYI